MQNLIQVVNISCKFQKTFNFLLNYMSSRHSPVLERLVANKVVYDFFSLQSLVNFQYIMFWIHYATHLVVNIMINNLRKYFYEDGNHCL